MKKGYVITIVCLVLALCVLGGLIYFDLFHNKENATPESVDITLFQEAMQDIEDSKVLGVNLWILVDSKGEPELFRYDKALHFTAEIIKENKAAVLRTTLATEHITHTGYYELYYDDGWKLELTDGHPVMIVEKTTRHFENMNRISATLRAADRDANPTAAQLEAAKAIIEKRLIAKNIDLYEIHIDTDSDQIHLEFPWADTDNAAVQNILSYLTAKGTVQFYEGAGTTDTNGAPVPPAQGKLILDGNDVTSATAMMNQDVTSADSSPYIISIQLTDAGKMKLATATQNLIGSTISVWLDRGEMWAHEYILPQYAMLSAPTVDNAITDGQAIITGFASYEDARTIADLIAATPLPIELSSANVSIIKAEK